MKTNIKKKSVREPELLSEYAVDYSKTKRNPYASELRKKPVLKVNNDVLLVIDDEVLRAFGTVNNIRRFLKQTVRALAK